MKRIWRQALVVAVMALAGTVVQAQGAKPAPSDTGGFLWEARKGNARVFLLATIHVGRADAPPAPWDCARRRAAVDVVAIEADVFDAQKVGAAVQRLAMFAPGEPGLDTRLPEPLRKRIEALLPRYGVDPQRMWRLKPWMLGNTLTILEADRNGFTPAFATEALLYDYANRCGKPLVEIEGIERQLAVFDSAPAELQVAILEQTVGAIESGASLKEIERIVSAWDKGDAAAVEKLLAEMHASQGVAERFVVEKLIDDRHPAMVETAERYAASGKPHLFAVGTLHYFGANGLLALLRARGYTITPVK